MKKIAALLSVLPLFAVVGCIRVIVDHQGNDSVNRVTVGQSRTGEVAAASQKISIDNRFGPVTVIGADERFDWQWDLKIHGPDEATAEQFLSQCRLDVGESNGTLSLALVVPEQHGRHSLGIESALQMRVPKSVAVEVRNGFGASEVTSVSGPVVVKSASGRVRLQSIEKSVRASTSFAELIAEKIGPAKLSNQSGGIDVRDASGDLTATTSFGGLRVRNVKGIADLSDQSGEISAIDVSGEVKAHTAFGRLHVERVGPATLSNQSGALEAIRVGGNLVAETSFSGMQVQDVHGTAELKNQSGEILASGVSGNIKARTSFARMSLTGQGELISARDVSGAIEIVASSPQTTRIEATTSFSPIAVRLPSDSKPEIRAETSFGKVHSDFPVLTDSLAEVTPDSGHLKVSLKTQSADIHVRRLVTQEAERP